MLVIWNIFTILHLQIQELTDFDEERMQKLLSFSSYYIDCHDPGDWSDSVAIMYGLCKLPIERHSRVDCRASLIAIRLQTKKYDRHIASDIVYLFKR